VRLDLAAMSFIAPILVGRIPVAALTNPPALVELFAETIVEELDFRLEAQNMLDIAAVFAHIDQRSIVVPRPHPELVTRRVLVMEHLHGFRWGNAAGMRAAGIDTAAVLRTSLIAFLEGALLYGVFHGDLHGGNLLVQPDGTVALLDFGITGRLDQRKRLAFLRLQMGATSNNVTVQVEALRDLGALPADSDVEAVIRDLGLDRPAVDPTTLSADEMVEQLREVTKALLGYGARLPKELMLFVKDILFLNGAMATMAPDVDILGEILAVVTYFNEHHGEQIARDVGVDLARLPGGHGVPGRDRSHHVPGPPGAARAHPPTIAAAQRQSAPSAPAPRSVSDAPSPALLTGLVPARSRAARAEPSGSAAVPDACWLNRRRAHDGARRRTKLHPPVRHRPGAGAPAPTPPPRRRPPRRCGPPDPGWTHRCPRTPVNR
jgi:hypothetical protein